MLPEKGVPTPQMQCFHRKRSPKLCVWHSSRPDMAPVFYFAAHTPGVRRVRSSSSDFMQQQEQKSSRRKDRRRGERVGEMKPPMIVARWATTVAGATAAAVAVAVAAACGPFSPPSGRWVTAAAARATAATQVSVRRPGARASVDGRRSGGGENSHSGQRQSG